ncbi:MAG TPA: cation diffusion facilitator family transporter [Chitinophagales bacterium]|nr:cation diffusion facilitator family transporter [Chitinophagales bacterium]HMW13554.1 cation diffusion facilitator family transporter [Chitinophagales bacterium]HMY23629.1 cation diffusion facilitator family transporter [Chitinophagales bacterium]HMZ34165.1 cation diffusion facilitator family transporter [Chitinophagales bacterium]HNC70816.1 cation diffusion facilitator family transporter [Chitinophagales bacterium]
MSIAQQAPNNKEKFFVQSLTLVVGLALLLVKFFAYFTTNSNAILTDALESIVNIVAGSFGLYSLYLAAKPNDEDHPYGHGKVEFISASIEGSLIAATGIAMIIKSSYNFFVPTSLDNLDVGLMLIVIAGIINFILGKIAVAYGKKNSSLTLIASGEHLKVDAYTSVGILLGLGIVYFTDFLWLDNVVAILMGIFIVYNGIKILKKSVAGIMDEADFFLLEKVVVQLNDNRRMNWIDIHNLRIIKFGEKIHIDCHTTIPWYFNANEVHEELKLVESNIKQIIPNNLETFIHADPCLPKSCRSCLKTDCKVRQFPFERKIEWTLENVMKNEKHFLEKT